MTGLGEAWLAAAAGLAAGAALGAAARCARFCVMGAIEDCVYGAAFDRLRMLGVAAAVAIVGVWALVALGALDPLETGPVRRGVGAAGVVCGGLIFGYGMALVGTCAFGALARVGGGDLRSLAVVCTIGLSAYATTAGPLSGLRLWLAPPREGGSLALQLEQATGLPAWAWGAAAGVALAAAAVRLAGGFEDRRLIAWGAAAGGAVALGWAATAALSGGFDVVPVESLSFAAPTGEAMLHLMTRADAAPPSFPVAGVLGVILGAAAAAALMRDARWETSDDPRELRRQLIGGALMGVGAALALGCTIGQGLSALSLLAPMAPVAMLAIAAGARAGLFVLVEGFELNR